MTSLLLAANSISVIRGSSKTLALTITDSSDRPVDLTGCTLSFSVKNSTSEKVPLIFKSTASVSQIDITDAVGGVAEVYLKPADTQNLRSGEYVFDVWLTTVALDRIPIVPPSTFEVLPGVTLLPL